MCAWTAPLSATKGGGLSWRKTVAIRLLLSFVLFLSLLSSIGYNLDMDEKALGTATVPTTQLSEVVSPRQESKEEIYVAPLNDHIAPKAHTERLENARGWESDALIGDMEKQLEQSGDQKGMLDLEFKNPKHFTWILVAFASMGGLLSGLDQSLISGANLTLPRDLHLSDQQNSLVNSGMPLGGKSLSMVLQFAC